MYTQLASLAKTNSYHPGELIVGRVFMKCNNQDEDAKCKYFKWPTKRRTRLATAAGNRRKGKRKQEITQAVNSTAACTGYVWNRWDVQITAASLIGQMVGRAVEAASATVARLATTQTKATGLQLHLHCCSAHGQERRPEPRH